MSVELPGVVATTQRRLAEHGHELVRYHRGQVALIDALLDDPPPEHAQAVDQLRGVILRERDRHLTLAARIERVITDTAEPQAPDQGEREEHHG